MSALMEDFPRRHRISVDEYERMAETGVLAPDARVELIEGEIIEMPPIGSRHAAAVSQLYRILDRAVGDRGILQCQGPLLLGGYSMPEPDFALLVPRDDFYASRRPTPADTLLLIEVSDTTLRYDTRIKAPLYARHAIPEVWIIDVDGKRLRTFRQPVGETYQTVLESDLPGLDTLVSLPGVSVDLTPLFRGRSDAPP
jgi:Uma2 family endonuclease